MVILTGLLTLLRLMLFTLSTHPLCIIWLDDFILSNENNKNNDNNDNKWKILKNLHFYLLEANYIEDVNGVHGLWKFAFPY